MTAAVSKILARLFANELNLIWLPASRPGGRLRTGGSAPQTKLTHYSKIRTRFEFAIPFLNLCSRQSAKPVHPELLAAEAAHHRAVDHCAAPIVHIHCTGA